MWNVEPVAYHLHAVSWANLKLTTEPKHNVECIKMDIVLAFVVRVNEQTLM